MAGHSISVVIPAYNAGQYLAQAIESALHQTLPPDEIIVVDDGSRDNTSEVAKRFGERVRYCRQDNSGPSAARNCGVAMATGEWIAFLDSDDVWFPHKLAVQAATVDTLGSAALLCAGVITFAGTPPVPPSAGAIAASEALTLDRLLRRNRVVTSTVLVPRAEILKAGGFETRYRGPEDFALWLRLAGGGLAILRQPAPLAAYRIVPGSLSQQAFKMRDQELQIIQDVFGRFNRQLPARLRAESVASVYFRAGVALAEAGAWRAALREVIHSTKHWPFGLTEYSRTTTLVRVRLLRRILLQVCCKNASGTRE